MNIVPEGKRSGVLLVNTGTPAVPKPRAVRKYLAKFLMDKRIAPMNRAGWWFVLHLFILPKRGRASAEKYQKIWTDEGSPFTIAHQKLEAGLGGRVRGRGAGRCGALRHELQRPVGARLRARAQGRGLHASHRASAVPAKRLLDHRLGVRQRGARAQEGALGRAVRLRRQLPRRPHLHPRHRCVHRACRFQGGL